MCLYTVWSNSRQFSVGLQGHSTTPAGFERKNRQEKERENTEWREMSDYWCRAIMWLSLKTKMYCRCHFHTTQKVVGGGEIIIMQAFPGLVTSDRYYNNSITHPCTNTPLSLNTSAEKIVTALSCRLIQPGTTGAPSEQCISSWTQKRAFWVCSRRIIWVTDLLCVTESRGIRNYIWFCDSGDFILTKADRDKTIHLCVWRCLN